MKIFFKLVSILFHPLLLPTYGTLIYMWANPSLGQGPEALRIKGVIFFNSFVMPAVAIGMMKALGFIKSFEMHDKQERIIPFIATMTFYIWTFLVVKNSLQLPPAMIVFVLGTVIAVMASFFINLFHKLSIHMVGMGGLITAVLMMLMSAEKSLMPILLAVFLVAGLTASARLYLKAHTPMELYSGFLVGICSQLIAMTVFSKLMA